MSGHKIVPLLEKHKDVFVHGGPVARHKMSFADGRKQIPESGCTELVLCASATFKLWQPKPKAPPPAGAAAAPSTGDAADDEPLNSSPVAPPPPPMPRPMLVWRQPHGFIKGVVPLGGKSRSFAFGFAVLFFAPHKEGSMKATQDMTDYAREYRKLSAFITPENSIDHVTPPLRVREYRTTGEYEQDDWCLSYRTTLFNYWHERLEAFCIPSPEIFQYQCFAVDVTSQPLVDSMVPHGASKAPVVQLAVSTERVYWIPRGTAALLERDHPLPSAGVMSNQVSSITSVRVVPTRGNRLQISFQGGQVWRVACFSAPEGAELLVELQRIWNLTQKEGSFPVTAVTSI